MDVVTGTLTPKGGGEARVSDQAPGRSSLEISSDKILADFAHILLLLTGAES